MIQTRYNITYKHTVENTMLHLIIYQQSHKLSLDLYQIYISYVHGRITHSTDYTLLELLLSPIL